jgi:cell division protein YceG involved in septum cleavage
MGILTAIAVGIGSTLIAAKVGKAATNAAKQQAAALQVQQTAQQVAVKQEMDQTQVIADKKALEDRNASESALKAAQEQIREQQKANETAQAANRLSEAKSAEERKQVELENTRREKAAEQSRVTVQESQRLDAQDKGRKVAEVAIGTDSASDALLRNDATGVIQPDEVFTDKPAAARKIGGVRKAASTVGGLKR